MQRRPHDRPGSRIKPIVSAVYDNVHMALWAALITGLIFMGAFSIPGMLAARSSYETQRARAIDTEDAFYCSKWGMGAGSGRRAACMSDLEQFRRSVEKRLTDESFF